MRDGTKTGSGGEHKWLRYIVTSGALLLILIHLVWPKLAIDAITIVLFVTAFLPWLAPIFKSLELPGGWKFEFQELRRAAQDQASVTLHQTIATIISWVQAEEIRESRRLLFDLEDKQAISKLPADQWQEEWKQAADRVSQAFNSAAIVAHRDERLEEIWIRPTRRAILKSWWIAQPRIRERRKQVDDLWQQFEWLAKKAEEYCKGGEQVAWCKGDAAEQNCPRKA